MQIKASNSQFKPKLLKIILTLLIILTAVQFTNPITAYASSESNSTNVTSLNGEAEHGYGSQVGKMHWAGKTERTGFMFYFTSEYGTILGNSDLGINTGNNVPFGIVVINEKFEEEISKATDIIYHTREPWSIHYGDGEYTSNEMGHLPIVWSADAPTAVKFDDKTGRWSGNGQDVAEWLFTECTDGNEVWENIILDGLRVSEISDYYDKGQTIIDKLKALDSINIVIEPLAANAVYGTKTWDDEASTFNLNLSDVDFAEYKHPDNYKPAIDENGRIIRVLTTASYMSEYIYKVTSGNKNPCPTGGANWKWTNEALPFCMTFQEPALGKEAIDQSTKPTRLDYETINSKTFSYGMGALTKEIKADFIETYDGSSSGPAPSQQPDPNKNTTGECTITKIYFDINIDGLTGEKTYKFIKAFTTPDTTGNIVIQPEYGKTDYDISKWATTLEQKDYSKYYNDAGYDDIVKKLSTATFNGDRTRLVRILKLNNNNNGEEGKRKHLYIVYTKTTTTPPPSIQSHDFEIPESYITKQVYFSKAQNTSNTQNTAQKLTKNTFKWTSEAHNNCQGHEALTCTTPEHTHTTALSYRAGSINCGYTYEHTHSDGDSCIRYQYKCLAQSISQCIKNNQPSIPPNHKVFKNYLLFHII